MRDRTLARLLEEWVEELGYEVVELQEAGSTKRPLLRLRVDRPDATEEEGITVHDCVRVSRALEEKLDQREGLSATYVLEVSSPGVERPLVRPRDFERFRGKEVALQGKAPLAGRAKKLEGELLGLQGEPGDERVLLRLGEDDEVEVPYQEISKANLVFRWGGERPKS
jgi:ribosome maturation factor RimP